ncbi:MAG: YlxR family protein [Sporomusaceae bacterium]|nr:YlxR family protein [Sporomusaceae bacterium]
MMKQKKIPQRLCVGCQELKNKKELTRIVRSPEGEVSIDPTGKKAGRGAYVCKSKVCLEQAFKGKRLERSLKQVIDPAVYQVLLESVEQE